MNDLLRQLTEAVGVSGGEKEVRLLIRELIADHVSVRTTMASPA